MHIYHFFPLGLYLNFPVLLKNWIFIKNKQKNLLFLGPF